MSTYKLEGDELLRANTAAAPRAQSKAEKVLRAFHEEERYTNIYDLKLARQLWGYLTPYRALLISAVVIMVLTALAALARPLVMKHGIDDVILRGDKASLLPFGLLFATLLLGEQIMNFAQVYAMQVVGARAMADL